MSSLEKVPITIGYVTVDDPHDRRTWSGINYFLLMALESRVDRVVTVGPLRPQPELHLLRLANQLLLRTTRKRFHYRDSFMLSKAYARIIKSQLEGVDLIVAPAGLATTAMLPTQVPVVYINDRCTAGALDYHQILSGLADFSRKESLKLEQKALERAAIVAYSSHWAAEAAMRAYPSISHKVHVVPFGANLEEAPEPPAARPFPPERLKLLMLGVKWEEKGGPIAYQALQELKRLGQAAQLVVCGCTPPPEFNDPDLVREGFLNKNLPSDMAKLEHHLRTADFLILPTRFEAYGIVFCEAAAYGLPVLASRTGGIPTIVEEGRTGFLFSLEQDGGAYADGIMHLVQRPEEWQAMRRNARSRFEGTLTWDQYVSTLLRLVQEAGLVNKSR
ncbi:MAG: glycosyltransferase family 4 protein [Bacteroidetes bacterium]|nr:glycosyltransferase family 4 protein [Bacteroidota bacterium]MBS1944367.1 glycosyltransferase family 4 protein [Bacteroidota bacterium]